MGYRRPFDSLTKRGRAVRVAKDVLLQIKAAKLVPFAGLYLEPIGDSGWAWSDSIVDTTKKCMACARGAMVYSTAMMGRPFLHIGAGSSMEPLREFFDTDDEIFTIENWFEGHQTVAAEFSGKYYAAERLTKIMQNIVNNRGKFRPEQLV